MSHNSVFCRADHEEATVFCLCGTEPLYLCPTCLPKHEGHERYPVAQADLFQAIGKNKEELKRRNTLSQCCQSFLDRVMQREVTVQSEAKTLMNKVTKYYEMWLEGNHRCFDNLLSTLRSETAMLLTTPKYRLSLITQNLLEKLESLNLEDVFAQVPEIETFTHLTERCEEACSRAPMKWQRDYEDEVLKVLAARQLDPQEREVVPDENLQLKAELRQLQADLEVKNNECESLKREIEIQRELVLSKKSELDRSQIKLGKNIIRNSELEKLNKQLSIKLETTTHDLQALQAESRTQATQLTESLKTCSDLERQLKELGQKQEETQHQLQDVQTEYEAKVKNCASLEKEKTELQREVQFQADQMQETEALCKRNLAEVNEKHSVLEERLRKWEITTDPPTDFQEPDYSTRKSKSARDKFGPYSDQDDELILTKRTSVTDEKGVYIGQWNSEGQEHGYGKCSWKNGDIYEGQWRNGQRTGRGRLIWAITGDVYVGDFLQNKMEGFGIYYYANGNEYSGAWVNDKKNGVGSFKYGEASQRAGNRYIGEYSDENRDGIGAYFCANGEMYVGSWKSDKFHGKGLQVLPDGQMYFGESIGGERSGIGCFVYNNGEVYRGGWRHNKKDGKCQITRYGVTENGIWKDGALLSKDT